RSRRARTPGRRRRRAVHGHVISERPLWQRPRAAELLRRCLVAGGCPRWHALFVGILLPGRFHLQPVAPCAPAGIGTPGRRPPGARSATRTTRRGAAGVRAMAAASAARARVARSPDAG